MNNLLQRYLDGDCIAVYQEIENLNLANITALERNEIEDVLAETFQRVSYNLNIIHTELKALAYVFNSDAFSVMQEPLASPYPDTAKLLSEVQAQLQAFGYLPLSLHYFYRYVGGVDFSWDYNAQAIIWPLADPIQVYALPDLLEIINNDEWLEEFAEIFDEEGISFLHLSSDVYHKDNISGGFPYAIALTEKQSVDTKWLFESHETTFINYLRICFAYGGFPGAAKLGASATFAAYLEKVKPQLKAI